MALKLKIGKADLPQVGDTIYVYYANTSILVAGLTESDGSGNSLSNPFTVPSDSDWYGFEPPNNKNVDVWWSEGGEFIVKDLNVSNPNYLDDPFPQYVLVGDETDPLFNEWDKSEGIQITLSQVNDWGSYQEELVSGTNIKTINGQSVLGSGDMVVYGDPLDETDPIFTAWDKSTGISITESQISDFGDYQETLLSGYNIKTVNGDSLLGYGNLTVEAEELDPIFTAWDKSTGITIYESQIIDLYPSTNIDLITEEGTQDLSAESGSEDLSISGAFQERLINEVNIKSLNGVNVLGNGNLERDDFLWETDPIFTAWDKSTGISITESQITDLKDYNEPLVSGTNIKTVNGESLLGSGDLVVEFPDFVETDPIFTAWNRSTGITITESQISDFGNYQEELTTGTNIKTINGIPILGSGQITIEFNEELETDPIFTAWDKSSGITIYESQISDLGNYQEELVSGTNIKTINGESVLGSEKLYIYGDELTSTEVVTSINDYLGNTTWQTGVSANNVSIGDVVSTYSENVDTSWLLCDGTKRLVSEYPTLANVMRPETPVGTGNEMFVWGYNNYGELGLGYDSSYPNYGVSSVTQLGNLSDWADADSGERHTIAIKTDNTIWAWGVGSSGQLGLNSTSSYSSPVQIGTDVNWQYVTCGGNNSLALKTDGTLWSWGDNDYGQLGLDDNLERSNPTQVGSLNDWQMVDSGRYHVLAVKTDGTLWAWGRNEYGQLGLGDRVIRSSPVQVGSLTDWQVAKGGGNHSLAIKTDGTLWSWGSNDNGQLGTKDKKDYSSPVQIGSLNNWNKLATGWDHSVVLTNDGRMYSWGLNNMGQLGLGDTINRSEPTLVGGLNNWKDVDCGGYYFTLAVRELGTLWACGYNVYGQLGLGNTNRYSSPVQVGSLTNWSNVNCGYRHVTAINGGTVEEFYLPNLPSIDQEKWYIKATN